MIQGGAKMLGLSQYDAAGVLDIELSMTGLDDKDRGLGIDKAKAIVRVVATAIVANNGRIEEQLKTAGIVIE